MLKEGITFGNDQSGSGAALNSRQTMGSAASTERLEVIDRGITMGSNALLMLLSHRTSRRVTGCSSVRRP